MSNDDKLRYPIGKFAPQESYTTQELQQCIARIEALPGKVEALTRNFSNAQYDTPYREGGWTARQVLHHLPDSHMNAYIRFKWTLTEETPLIKAYDEKLWAQTPDNILDPQISVNFLKALHLKWTAFLKLIKPEDLSRQFVHPQTQKHVPLDRLIATYAWHGEHHLGHLEIVSKKV